MPNTCPKVSIGVAVYNGDKYLAHTLDSLLAQTYGDFEVIISDNASTDRTQDICHRYVKADSRFRYYRNDVNLGVAPNYNRVFHLSRGEYFKWADYDDVLHPDLLGRCVEILDRSPEVALCYCRVRIIDENGVPHSVYDPGPDTRSRFPGERFRNLILSPELAVQSMGLFRSRIVRETQLHGSYPSSDEVFLAEVALRGEFYEIEDRLLDVRLHPNQSTRGALAVQRSRVLFFDTSLAGRIVLPKWQYLNGCIKAANCAPLSASTRAYCYVQIARWLAKPSHVRALVKDLLLAGRQCLAR
ncbi:MAG: glycosyltransferase family 2 protein [Caldilinea sp.]